MPCKAEYAELFADKLKKIDDPEIQERIVKKMRDILSLDDPRDRGGAYLNKWWSYPFAGSCALVCEIKQDNETIIFRDIIMNL